MKNNLSKQFNMFKIEEVIKKMAKDKVLSLNRVSI